MNFNEYQCKASRTINPDLFPNEVRVNACLGLAGEAGEVIDYIKKGLHQGHIIELSKLKEEIGDVLWYLSELCTAFDISLQEAAEGNIEKLKKRYPDGFFESASINRKE